MAEEILNDARFAKAGDVMTKYVFYIDGDKSVADAIRLMKAESLSSLVVNRRDTGGCLGDGNAQGCGQ